MEDMRTGGREGSKGRLTTFSFLALVLRPRMSAMT
jgi:hypothetical protein